MTLWQGLCTKHCFHSRRTPETSLLVTVDDLVWPRDSGRQVIQDCPSRYLAWTLGTSVEKNGT